METSSRFVHYNGYFKLYYCQRDETYRIVNNDGVVIFNGNYSKACQKYIALATTSGSKRYNPATGKMVFK